MELLRESSQKLFKMAKVFKSTFTLAGILNSFSVEINFKQLSSVDKIGKQGVVLR